MSALEVEIFGVRFNLANQNLVFQKCARSAIQ